MPPINLTSPPPIASFLNHQVPISAIASTPKSPTPAPKSDKSSFCHQIPSKLGFSHANAKPRPISPREKRSGIIISSKSMTDKITSAYTAAKTTNIHGVRPYRQTNKKVSTPVKSSTSGYCTEIGCLQFRHLPRNHKKLNTGILSYHLICALHLGQAEGGHAMDFSRGMR